MVANPTAACLPQGMPRFMVATYPLEILQTPGQVTLIAEWSSQVRRIFTDGRKHPPPDEIDITFNGHSIGHWEGQTLVVDTIGIQGDTSFDASPLEHSDQIRVTERIRLMDPNTIEAQMAVISPVAFASRGQVVHQLQEGRAEPLQIAKVYVCEENNREVILPGQVSAK